MQDIVNDPMLLAKVVVIFAAASAFMRGSKPSSGCACNTAPRQAAPAAPAAPPAMAVSDVANPTINAAKRNRDQLSIPSGQIASSGVIGDLTIDKPALAPKDFKGTQQCSVGEPPATQDALMNASELFPKKVSDEDGFDTVGVMDIDTAQALDGVFPDTGAVLETTWNQSSDLRGDCAVESCTASDPFGGTMLSSHHCGFKDGKIVRSTVY